MGMTSEERSRCEDIIHSCSAAAVAGHFVNPIRIPGLGEVGVDSAVMVGMGMKLASVFGESVTKGNVEGMALAAFKEAVLNNVVKSTARAAVDWIPFIGPIVTSGLTIAIIEEAGWTLAEQFANAKR